MGQNKAYTLLSISNIFMEQVRQQIIFIQLTKFDVYAQILSLLLHSLLSSISYFIKCGMLGIRVSENGREYSSSLVLPSHELQHAWTLQSS